MGMEHHEHRLDDPMNLFILKQGKFIIADMIKGEQVHEESKKLPHFLFEIIANKHAEVDIDKYCYLTLDARSIGNDNDLEIPYIFQHTRVCPSTQHLIWSIKAAQKISHVFVYRRLMFSIYQHEKILKLEFAMFKLFESLFKIFDVVEILNNYKENGHRWRLLLNDNIITALLTMLQFQPQWLKPISVDDIQSFQMSLTEYDRIMHAKIIADYEDKAAV